MREEKQERPTPIYSTSGEWCAIIERPYIFDTQGEWIGWVSDEEEVFDVDGGFVGWLDSDQRVLRHRAMRRGDHDRRDPPKPPGSIRPPASVPLPPLMPELPAGTVDVFDEHPGLLHTTDYGRLKEDMD
jgi:hypothetical protein